MPKNVQLEQAIQNIKNIRNKTEAEKAITLLDALLKGGLADKVTFRKAIKSGKEEWNKLSNGLVDDNNVNEPNDKLPNDFLNDGPPTLDKLYEDAVQTRIELGLSFLLKSGEVGAVLKAADATADAAAANIATRNKIATLPDLGFDASKIKDFETTKETILPAARFTQIKQVARRAFLSKHIDVIFGYKDFKDDVKLENLKTLLLAAGDNGVKDALPYMQNSDPTIQDTMTRADVDSLKDGLALKVLTLEANLLANDAGNMNVVKNALEGTDQAFIDSNLFNVTRHLSLGDIPKAKGILGGAYLNRAIELTTKMDLLTDIAKTTKPEDIRRLLKDEADPTTYLKQAVTDDTVKNGRFRHFAARRVVNDKIAQSTDIAALKLLAGAQNITTVQSVLENNLSFGLQGDVNKELRNVLEVKNENEKNKDKITEQQKETNNLIAATAHIRYSALTGLSANTQQYQPDATLSSAQNAKAEGRFIAAQNANRLKDIIRDSATYATDFNATFPPANEAMKKIIDEKFKDENIKKSVRETALTGFIKASITTLSADQLDKLSLANTAESLKNAVTSITGNNDAQDLLNEEGATFHVRKIRVYATLQKGLNQTPVILEAFQHVVNTTLANTPNHILSQSEKNQYIAIYVERAMSGINDKAQLKSLAEGNNFAAALTAIGITQQDWINDAGSKQRVQRAASKQLFNRLVLEAVGNEPHPSLNEVFDELPLEKQIQVLSKPNQINALLRADNADQIKAILGPVKKTEVDKILNENKQPALLNQIHNAKISELLKTIPNLPTFTQANIVAINKVIAEKSVNGTINFTNSSIKPVLDIIKPIVNNDAAFMDAFKVNEANGILGVGGGVVFPRIQAQQSHNIPLATKAYAPNNPPKAHEAALINFLLPLAKDVPFTEANLTALITLIKTAKTPDELITAINAAANADLKNNLPPAFIPSLTQQKFANFKQNVTREALKVDANLGTTLQAEKTKIKALNKDILKSLESFVDNSADDLATLAELTDAKWLEAGFGAQSKENAFRLKSTFEELDKDCDILIKYLKRQRLELDGMLKSLPKDTEVSGVSRDNKKTVREHKNLLIDTLILIDDQLKKLEPVQQILRPDPDSLNPFKQKGLLGKIEEAITANKVIRFGSTNVVVEKLPLSELGSAGQTNTAAAQLDITGQIDTSEHKVYDFTDKVAPGYFNKFSVSITKPDGTQLTSSFTEQRETHDMVAVHKDFQTTVSPGVKYTISKFAQQEPDMDSEEFRCDMEAAMVMAREVIANAIKANKPVNIGGSNAYHVKMLWSAVMVMKDLGDDKKLKLADHHVKVISTAFDPKSEYRWGGMSFTNESVYKKMKSSPAFASMKKQVEQLQKDKAEARVQKKEVKASAVDLITRFKDESKAVKQMQDENTKAEEESNRVGRP